MSHASPSERRRGYLRALEHAGLAEDHRVLIGGHTESDGARAGDELTQEMPAAERPTAVFAFNDRCALGVMQAVGRAGWRVPEDLSVVGYDDSRLATWPWVNLTTVRQDTAQIADQAVVQAIASIDAPGPRTAVIVPPRLMVRASAAQPSSRAG